MKIKSLYQNAFLERIFKTHLYLLKRELAEMNSVLDLGCGPNSPLQNCPGIQYSLGVDAFSPYLERSREKNIHNDYLLQNIKDLKFDENSFEAVLLLDVLEHLPKEEGLAMLGKAQRWAKNKVIVSTPNGFIKQPSVDKNPLQKHLSGWTVKDFKNLGFSVRGLAGLRFLRKAKEEGDSMDDDILVSMKYKPRLFWFFIAVLSQTITYFWPKKAFGLFCVKDL
ncbi:methyltransferase domain-containing protein [candidate division WWE3 bacterium]|nr:methyltransferase domain-containing protein [candidate division WWE3 bacterium]